MKIWEAFLILKNQRNKEFYTRFGFRQLEEDFVEGEGRMSGYWLSEDEDYIASMNMEIDTSFCDLYISQGFDRELSEKEQELLEIKMKVYLKEYLRKENERMNKQYECKMAAIKF